MAHVVDFQLVIDKASNNHTRPSCTRVKVELDLLKKLDKWIQINCLDDMICKMLYIASRVQAKKGKTEKPKKEDEELKNKTTANGEMEESRTGKQPLEGKAKQIDKKDNANTNRLESGTETAKSLLLRNGLSHLLGSSKGIKVDENKSWWHPKALIRKTKAKTRRLWKTMIKRTSNKTDIQENPPDDISNVAKNEEYNNKEGEDVSLTHIEYHIEERVQKTDNGDNTQERNDTGNQPEEKINDAGKGDDIGDDNEVENVNMSSSTLIEHTTRYLSPRQTTKARKEGRQNMQAREKSVPPKAVGAYNKESLCQRKFKIAHSFGKSGL
ncbi:hypothetical protein H5410_036172 [Solanum commersonii]|uniref:Uncharacterized protein n=1 Tax=Solanum commersonii TaxID=4109 RepID=A0A9J5Y6S3_SOLCO|nr:hypothetical protein H5410_036172 [Solanum commersonii]